MGNLTSLRFTYGQGTEEFENWDAIRAGVYPNGSGSILPRKGDAPLVWFIHLPVSDFKG